MAINFGTKPTKPKSFVEKWEDVIKAAPVVKQTVAKPDAPPSRAPQAPKSRPVLVEKPAEQAVTAPEAIGAKRGRPALNAPKVAVTLRLDPAVVAAYRADGADWRARMAEALKAAKV